MNRGEGSLAALWLHDDVHFATEPGQHSHDAYGRDIAELSFQHSGKVGLADAGRARGFGLRELAVLQRVLHAAHHLSLEEVRVRIRKADIGKDIRRTEPNAGVVFLAHLTLRLRAMSSSPAARRRAVA